MPMNAECNGGLHIEQAHYTLSAPTTATARVAPFSPPLVAQPPPSTDCGNRVEKDEHSRVLPDNTMRCCRWPIHNRMKGDDSHEVVAAVRLLLLPLLFSCDVDKKNCIKFDHRSQSPPPPLTAESSGGNSVRQTVKVERQADRECRTFSDTHIDLFESEIQNQNSNSAGASSSDDQERSDGH